MKHVPGRKTDVKDSEWLAQLLEWGLLRSSLVPPPPIRELREVTRYRKHQIPRDHRRISAPGICRPHASVLAAGGERSEGMSGDGFPALRKRAADGQCRCGDPATAPHSADTGGQIRRILPSKR